MAATSTPAAEKTAAADYFVAPDGNDQWTGRLAKPNSTRTDGPFASLIRARDAVRELKRHSAQQHIVVRLRGGTHHLRQTLTFSLEDSAPAGGSITYAAYKNEKPVISSAVPVRHWRPLTDPPPQLNPAARGKIWVADLPPEITRCLTLYDGAARLPRARSQGFAPADARDKKTWPDQFAFPRNTLSNWPDLTEGELLVIPTADYEMCILPLASVDETNAMARTSVPASRRIGRVKFIPVSVWVENVLAALDEPGEWAVNTRERKIYLWPRRGRPGENIVVPQLTELLRVEGSIDYAGPSDIPVRGLIFRGLTFTHAERFPWHGGMGWGMQHYWEIFDHPTAAVRMRGTESCAIESCRFTANSGTALRLDLHSRENRIVDNEISHAGGVGILLAGYGPGTKDVHRHNIVSNNWIHHIGEIYWASPALMVWQSGENQIANNLIHDTPYSGITVSTRAHWNPDSPQDDRSGRWAEIGSHAIEEWGDRERFMHARNNRVERNDIHDVMQIMGDGDGIYISGTGGGNLIRQNYIHHSDGDGMADGIRCDDDQHEVTIESNVIYRLRCIGMGICSKGTNHIVNNIIADLLPTRRPIRPELIVRGYIGLEVNPVTGSRIERNIVVARRKDYPPLLEHLRYGTGPEPLLRECRADNNLYHCLEDPAWGTAHLQKQQPFGVELHSLSADPLFVNFERGDLRLKPQSPALKLGFQPIEFRDIGLRANHPFYRR